MTDRSRYDRAVADTNAYFAQLGVDPHDPEFNQDDFLQARALAGDARALEVLIAELYEGALIEGAERARRQSVPVESPT